MADRLPHPERDDYGHSAILETRWHDNDVYGHVNNIEYYSFVDTAINRILIERGRLDIHGGDVIGVCVESHCEYLGALAYPAPVEVRIRVGKLSDNSVRWEFALFDGPNGPAAARGWFVHVFVDRYSRRPAGVPDSVRTELEPLLTEAAG